MNEEHEAVDFFIHSAQKQSNRMPCQTRGTMPPKSERFEHAQVIDKLRRAKIDGKLPLHTSILHCQPPLPVELLQVVIGTFADDLESRDACGRTPLLLALATQQRDAAALCLAANADASVIDDTCMGVLHYACRAGDDGQLIRLLCKRADKGTLVTAAKSWDFYGLPPLHWLIRTGTPELLAVYCRSKLPLDVRDLHGNTCWHALVAAGQIELIQPLLLAQDHHVDLFMLLRNDAMLTPLALAQWAGDAELLTMMAALVEARRQPGESDNDMVRGIHDACGYVPHAFHSPMQPSAYCPLIDHLAAIHTDIALPQESDTSRQKAYSQLRRSFESVVT
eukprot:TRINITY_DN10011_c0_g1_i10.p1 TRINITY_DN10011_c0_g1~~TRINITY_DN10011_c0_g1_i10.p1  ORF type:complete len:336 (+),score=27.35 TRINITY_DN10011_c0_g1_i10:306-1313(+)